MKACQQSIITIVVILILFTFSLHAQTPQLLNYQGKLTIKDGSPATGTFVMIFSIYSEAESGKALWDETQNVTVANGIFNVLLGSVRSFTDTLFTTQGNRYLGIRVGTDPEMKPRFQLTSVAYAMHASSANRLSAADGNHVNAVTVDENGNVGIGTTHPQARLDIKGGDNSFAWQGDHSDSSYVRIGNLQICWGSLSVGGGQTWASSASGCYLKVSQKIAFQKPFSNYPVISFSIRDHQISDRSAYVSCYTTLLNEVKDIYLTSPASNNSETSGVTLRWIAIGTWQ